MSNKLKWYWNRLQAMSFEEIFARSRTIAKTKMWRNRSTWNPEVPQLEYSDPWELIGKDLQQYYPEDYKGVVDEANSYLDGSYTLLNLEYEEQVIDWHLDPASNKRAPLNFGLDIDYRDSEAIGNVKNIWEKSRHHHITILALAYALTRNKNYSNAVERQLFSWIEHNPFPIGINWSSSLELGVRLISWTWIERFLRGSQPHAHLFGINGQLWESIYWHQWLISQHYSPGSSANNHLIGEMAGLFMSACQWPVFSKSASWKKLSQSILEREIHNQTFSSGLNREQAFSYHIFSLEFFLLSGLEGERFEMPFSDGYKDSVKQMLEVIPWVVDAGGNLPQYGDSDDGMALQLRPISSSRLAWLYRLGRQWLAASVPKIDDNSGALTATLIGQGIKDNSKNCTVKHYGSLGLPDAGFYVMASERGSRDEVFCLADAGPLGFLSIAAHGHADALSFTLSAGGTPIIVDSGTYTYHAEPVWRAYFKGTKAHNTITINDTNQSESVGTFLWTHKAKCRVLNWQPSSAGGRLVAQHDGYTRLDQAVVHQREIMLEQKRLEIFDELRGNGVHDIEWRLHFSPVCNVNLEGEVCFVKWPGGVVKICLDSELEYSVVKATDAGGWFSNGFNLKEPTYTLIGKINTRIPVHLRSTLEINYEN